MLKKSITIISFLTVFSSLALTPGKYTCQVTSSQKTMSFNFEYQADDELKCFNAIDEDYCETFFQFTPADQTMFYLDGLYDGGFGLDDNEDFVVSSDSSGCDMGELILSKESGYTKGTIESSFHCSGAVEKYSGDVSCKKN